MTTRAEDLFASAHELGVQERDAFLEEACGEDAELRLEVQRLLVDAERADVFFRDEGDGEEFTLAADGSGKNSGNQRCTIKPGSPPNSEKAPFRPLTEKEGDEVGPYRLLQKIGEGGFGIVWMAEQSEPISRRVALKVVKAGMDTQEVLVRFEAERQALAMMAHPNIATVLDAGATANGRPYFAMELVKGIPVTEFCDKRKLGPRRRLELFQDVCAAVNHAHQKGIIHRDIKPSNVMVTLAADQPLVKVIDFGIAKATHNKLTEKTLFTRFEQFLGTPAYMSPEQAAMSSLDVDTRADIYSLGVLLYELLAGAPPFDAKSLLSAGYDEMRRIIVEDAPPSPSKRLTQIQDESVTEVEGELFVSAAVLKGELDWIVMKAIEKERARRYETASEFAADIEHYLKDEPVQAVAPSAAYKFRKFAQRHKAAFGAAAAMVALLVAGIAATSWQALRATAEAQRATEAEGLAGERLEESEAARRDAEAISGFLIGMFEGSGNRNAVVADFLDSAVRSLKRDLGNQPERQAQLEAALAGAYRGLGLYGDAVPLREKVRNYYLEQGGPDHPETLVAMRALALEYEGVGGHLDEALAMNEEALTRSRRVLGPEHRDTLMAVQESAYILYAAGDFAAALEIREEVLVLSRKALGTEHPDTFLAMANLARSYSEAKRWDEAVALHEEAVELRRNLNGPEHQLTLGSLTDLAVSLESMGRAKEGLELRKTLLEMRRRVEGPSHEATIRAMRALADSYEDARQAKEALTLREDALKLANKAIGSESSAAIGAMADLSSSYFDSGRQDEALALRESVLELNRQSLGPEHLNTIGAMTRLSKSYAAAGRMDESIALEKEVVALYHDRFGPDHYRTLEAIYDLTESYYDSGRREEALPMREDLLKRSHKVFGAEHASTIWVTIMLSRSYHHAGRLDEALALREEALERARKSLEPEHEATMWAMIDLSRSYHAAGRMDEALKLRTTLLERNLRQLGPEHRHTTEAMTLLSESYQAAGRIDEAIELEEDALAIRRRTLPVNHRGLRQSTSRLAGYYRVSGRGEEAVALENGAAQKKAMVDPGKTAD